MTVSINTKEIMRQVHENRVKLLACSAHYFPQMISEPGKPFKCARCGGEVDGSYLLAYCEGFRHAGGDPGAVWPPYSQAQANMTSALKKAGI